MAPGPDELVEVSSEPQRAMLDSYGDGPGEIGVASSSDPRQDIEKSDGDGPGQIGVGESHAEPQRAMLDSYADGPGDTGVASSSDPRRDIEKSDGDGPGQIGVEVSYAEPQRAIVRRYRLALPAATVEDALRLACADCEFAGIDIGQAVVGIFGKVAVPQQLLEDGDRVEIYRPLAADPKSARRARARGAKS